MQGEQISYQIVLPTCKILNGLSSKEASPHAQFLVGYRNVLTCIGESISWGLVKSKLHCGRAFVSQIQQSEVVGIQKFKNVDQYIETVVNSFIFLKIEKEVIKPTVKLTVETLIKLLEEVGGVNKINLNILKNSFDSLQEYRNIVDVQVERTLSVDLGIKELEITDKIEIQYSSKILSGVALMQLPVISKDTGDWLQDKIVELKSLDH